MNENENLVPKRRFKEFKNTGTWEQRKLGEFADISTGKLDANAMVADGEYDFYTSGMKKYRIDTPAFEGPAITIAGNGATVGYMHLADGEFNAYQRTYVLQNFQANRYFLYSEISKKLPRKIAQEARTGNIPYIVMDMLTELTISLPVLEEEQAKIGAFFKQLDNTIALHQRKLEKSKALKSAYLSEMFPVEGERKPKRRFAGFTDDWEQRKLGELASFSKGAGYTKGDLLATGKPIILYGRLYTKYETVIENVDTFVDEKEKSVLSAGNEVIVPASGETSEDISRASVVAKPGIILGGDLNIVKPNTEIDSSFLALTISNGRQQKELSKKAQGKSVVHLHNSDLKEVDLVYPQKEEQSKIGTFFKQLDDAIALHQHKLEKLKNIKQAYLNELFV